MTLAGSNNKALLRDKGKDSFHYAPSAVTISMSNPNKEVDFSSFS